MTILRERERERERERGREREAVNSGIRCTYMESRFDYNNPWRRLRAGLLAGCCPDLWLTGDMEKVPGPDKMEKKPQFAVLFLL